MSYKLGKNHNRTLNNIVLQNITLIKHVNCDIQYMVRPPCAKMTSIIIFGTESINLFRYSLKFHPIPSELLPLAASLN